MSNSSDGEALRPSKKAKSGPQSGSLVHPGEQADSQFAPKSQARQPALASMVRSAPAQSAASGAADLHEEHSQAAQHPAVLASEASTTSPSNAQQHCMTWTGTAVSSPRALHRLASSGARAESHPGHEGHTLASHDHSCAAALQSAARRGRSEPGCGGPSPPPRHPASAAAPRDAAPGSSSATQATSLTRHKRKQAEAAVLNDEEAQKGFAGSDSPPRAATPACPNSGRLRISDSEERHVQAAICAAQKKVEWLGNKLLLMMLLPQAPAEGGTAKRHLWGCLVWLAFQHSFVA